MLSSIVVIFIFSADSSLMSFQLDNIESFFSTHLVLTNITLTCSPKALTTDTPKPSHGSSNQDLVTPKPPTRHPLIPSFTPVESIVSTSHVLPPPNLFTINEEDSGPAIRHQAPVEILQDAHGKPNPADKQRHVAKWLSQTKRHLLEPQDENSGEVKKAVGTKKMVYLSKTFIQFPDTTVGSRTMIKVPVNNRDSEGQVLEVIKPSPPFSVSHRNFNLGFV